MVTSALKAVPKTAPLSAETPDGISIAILYAVNMFIFSIAVLYMPSMFLVNPTPKTASITIPYVLCTGMSFKIVFPYARKISCCVTFEPVAFFPSPISTRSMSYPFSNSRRPIARPSPPLLPFPQTINILSFLSALFTISSHAAIAACSIKIKDGTLKNSVVFLSYWRISRLLTKNLILVSPIQKDEPIRQNSFAHQFPISGF